MLATAEHADNDKPSSNDTCHWLLHCTTLPTFGNSRYEPEMIGITGRLYYLNRTEKFVLPATGFDFT
jgi:hypothetical protein